MRQNLPITDRERFPPKGVYLVSETDERGIIVDANDAFVEISGFSREELIGSPHNIVRHPDMPPKVFEDLWRCLGQGIPWQGIVKNRSKDGGFYWVHAFVVPITKAGKISGFMSVRSRPEEKEVALASKLYRGATQADPTAHRALSVLSCKKPWLSIVRTQRIVTSVSMACLATGAGLSLYEIDGSTKSLLIAGGSTAMLAIVALSTMVSRRTQKGLETALTRMQRMAEGYLGDRLSIEERDEFGELNNEIAIMQTRIKVLIDRVMRHARQVNKKATDSTIEISRIREQSMVQHEAMGSINAITKQFAVSFDEVRTRAEAASEATQAARMRIETTSSSIQAGLKSGEGVIDSTQKASQLMRELEEAIRKVSAVSTTIHEIADQTNLLALNAAIEAARAGEQGRGFAVVADEVRKLANRTSLSTEDIERMIHGIEQLTSQTIAAMEAAQKGVAHGIGLMQSSAGGLQDIVEASASIAEQTEDIVIAAREQSRSAQRIAQEVSQMSEAVGQSEHSAAQAQNSQHQMKEAADALERLINDFKV